MLKRERDAWLKLYHQFNRPERIKIKELICAWDQLSTSPTYDIAMSGTDPAVGSGFGRWVASVADHRLENFARAWIDHVRSIAAEGSNRQVGCLQARCIRLIREVFDLPSSLGEGHYKSSPVKLVVIWPKGSKAPALALAGGEKLVPGVWTWIRGFHAFLYCEHLNKETRYRVLGDPPLVGIEMDVAKERAVSDSILGAIEVGRRAGSCDEIHAWGGRVQYSATWVVDSSPSPLARCCWSLEIAGALPGIRWCGFYDSQAPKAGAVIGEREFSSFPVYGRTP